MVPAKLSLRKRALKFQSLQNARVSFFFFFFVCDALRAYSESWSQAFLVEIMETGDKHRNVTDSLQHCRLCD